MNERLYQLSYDEHYSLKLSKKALFNMLYGIMCVHIHERNASGHEIKKGLHP